MTTEEKIEVIRKIKQEIDTIDYDVENITHMMNQLNEDSIEILISSFKRHRVSTVLVKQMFNSHMIDLKGRKNELVKQAERTMRSKDVTDKDVTGHG